MAKLSIDERQRAVALLLKGETPRKVSSLVWKSNGQHPTVRGVRKMWNSFRSNPFKQRVSRKAGCPSSLSKRERSRILWVLEESNNSFLECSSTYIRERLSLQASSRTIRRFLNVEGYFWKRPSRKHSYSPKELRARVCFAKEHCDISASEWKHTVFSDEVSFFWRTGKNALRARMCRRRGVYRRKGDSLRNGLTQPGRSSLRNGRLLKIICAMCNGHVVYFYVVDGKLNGDAYCVYLKNLADVMRTCYGVHSFRLLHDNVPLHNTSNCLEVIKNCNIDLIRIPPLSPDLNPIENAFSFARDNVEKATPSSTFRNFRTSVRNCFDNLSCDTLLKLAASMPRRIRAVIHQHGGPIKW